MSLTTIRVAIICKRATELQELVAKAVEQGVQAQAFASPTEFKEKHGGELFSGIIIDLRTSMEAPADEKRFLASIEDSFPFLKVVRKAATGEISGVALGEQMQGARIFEWFLKEKCPAFRPRGIRVNPRKPIHFNVEISLLSERLEDAFRANTLNASKGGVFVISTRELLMGQCAWLRIRELEDSTPIACVVRWLLPWGRSMKHLPGFGLQFEKLTDAQTTELNAILTGGTVDFGLLD